jgi:enamine deaminase RidA (YjgF/YER057c/UK114 family)
MNDVYGAMREKGLILPTTNVPAGLYTLGVTTGNLFFTSGKGWTENGKPPIIGRLGDELSVEQGILCARNSMLCLLANVERELGSLNKILRVVKLNGFIACKDDFDQQTQVLNGASQILVDIFGETKGKGARSAIGTNSLPMRMPVEVEVIFELA